MKNDEFELDEMVFGAIYRRVYTKERINAKTMINSDPTMQREIQKIIEEELKNVIAKN